MKKMKFDDVFCHTFTALRKKIGPEVRQQVDLIVPSLTMVEACRADDFDFFRPFLAADHLIPDQMRHACERYLLGKSKSGTPIFWLIDEMLQPLDAHIGKGWISGMLKQREPMLAFWKVSHCLFGLHLMMDDGRWMMDDGRGKREDGRGKPVCVVEREETAVVMSELMPEAIWMAYSMTSHLEPRLFAPLSGRIVTIYPRTEPTLSTYLFFLDLANQVHRLYDIDVTVDTTLDDHATPDQKERCIDILEFLLESTR